MILQKKTIVVFAFLVITAGWTGAGQAQVPSEYQSLYGELENLLADFEAQLAEKENDRTGGPVTFGLHLPLASSNRGESLLADNLRYSMQWQLDALSTLSVPSVYLEVNFPILTRSYHDSEETYRKYEDFYSWLAAEIRARGIRMIVKSQANFSNLRGQPDAELEDYYEGLSFEQYKQGRAETAVAVASLMRPDYLVLQAEPDTEQAVTGQPVNDIVNSVDLIGYMLRELEAAEVRTMRVGAGIGSWHREYQLFAAEYVNSTSIDFLDIHVYPINYDFLRRIDTLKEIAAEAGKGIAVSEAWLYKSSARELSYPAPAFFISRDPFGFWAPLDSRFLTAMTRLARLHEMEFFSPFWSNYMTAYVKYEDVQDVPGESISIWLAVHSFWNWLKGDLTETGRAYLEAIGQ